MVAQYPVTNSSPITIRVRILPWPSQVRRAIRGIRLHPLDSRDMDPRIQRNIANRATRRRPPHRLPRAIRLYIHPPKRKVLHQTPRQNGDKLHPVPILQQIMDTPLGARDVEGIQVAVRGSGRRFGGGGLRPSIIRDASELLQLSVHEPQPCPSSLLHHPDERRVAQ